MAFIEGELTTSQVGLKSHCSGSTRTNVHRIRQQLVNTNDHFLLSSSARQLSQFPGVITSF